jgi:1-acyl-sn-glycerol-3-phosphate acyltransferase
MSNFEFIFLQRNWADDKHVLTSRLLNFVKDKFTFWLLLFPEGTTVHQEALDKGHEFARKSGRPILKNLLLPRSTGFEAVLNAVGDAVDEVYDVTMCYTGYTGEIPTWKDGYNRKKDKSIPSIVKLFGGMKASPIFLYVRRYHVKDIIAKGVERWIDERWTEKDSILQHFAATGSLPDSSLTNKRVIRDSGCLSKLLISLLVPFAQMCGIIFAIRLYMYSS